MHPTKLEIPGWIRRRLKSAANPSTLVSPFPLSRIPLLDVFSGIWFRIRIYPPPDADPPQEKKQRVSRLEVVPLRCLGITRLDRILV